VDQSKAQVSLFLSLAEADGPEIWLKISSIEIVSETGETVPLLNQAVELDAKKIGSGQIFISRSSLPPGTYMHLKIRLEKSYVQHDDRKVFLALAKPVIEIPFVNAIGFKRTESRSLFIQWNTKTSLKSKAIINPAMSAAIQSSYLLAEFAYVACPDANTIYLLRTDTNRVIGSLGVTGRPTYLAADRVNRKLYILASGEAEIKVYDLEESNFLDGIQVPMTRNPSFMLLAQITDPLTGEEIQTAYILEKQSHDLVRLNLTTGEMLERTKINYKPQYAIYIPQYARLAVSAAESQAVYLLDPITLETREAISLGGTPQGMRVYDNLLFITEDNYRTVTIYDLNRLQVVSKLYVGQSPRRILFNNNRLYVTNYDEGSISIISPRQLIVSRNISLGKSRPSEIAYSLTRRWIYIGDEEYGGVSVLDPTTNKVVDRVHLGASPLGIKIIQ
jgi:YVTN family beta-propeller protein